MTKTPGLNPIVNQISTVYIYAQAGGEDEGEIREFVEGLFHERVDVQMDHDLVGAS